METTAYCGCEKCCNWERGGHVFLDPAFYDKTVASGPHKGLPYTGRTASGAAPHEPRPGLFSLNRLAHPWMIPIRIIFFPWLFLPRDGTIAADIRYFPFGTRIYVEGYGWGVVQDQGRAVQGADRLDLYFESHREACQWGRRTTLTLHH